MKIAEVMQSIYTRFEKSPDAPDITSEDFGVRLEYANSSIDKWENEQGVEWKELFGTITGTLTNGVCSDNVFSLLSFNRPAGFLKVGEDKYTYVRPEAMEVVEREYPSHKVYTVTGSKGGYSVVVNPVVSGTFSMNYRKSADKFTTGEETTPV